MGNRPYAIHSSGNCRGLAGPGRSLRCMATYHGGMLTLDAKRHDLLTAIRRLESCAVAFPAESIAPWSRKAAQLALGERAVAVTGSSASLAAGELDQAREVA